MWLTVTTMQETRRPLLLELEHRSAVYGNYNRPRTKNRRGSVISDLCCYCLIERHWIWRKVSQALHR